MATPFPTVQLDQEYLFGSSAGQGVSEPDHPVDDFSNGIQIQGETPTEPDNRLTYATSEGELPVDNSDVSDAEDGKKYYLAENSMIAADQNHADWLTA